MMNSNTKKSLIRIFTLLLIVCLSLVGCGKKANTSSVRFDKKSDGIELENQLLAENKNYNLLWNNDYNTFILTDKNGNDVMAGIPLDFINSGVKKGAPFVAMNSPLLVEYIDGKTLTIKSVKSHSGAHLHGRIHGKTIKNGIRVTYYFDEQGFSIPLEYTLCENGVEVKLLINEIVESEYEISKISVLPYLVSAHNQPNSYLFVPSGSGALIYTGSNEEKKYQEAVYGEDTVGNKFSKVENQRNSALPVFGAKDGENGVLAVIEEGADIAVIEASAGDSDIGYSGAYSSFNLRGSDKTRVSDHTGLQVSIDKFSDGRVSLDYASVKYIPLKGEKANYLGMASTYREMLEKNSSLGKYAAEPELLGLEIYGGALTRKLLFGLPYRSISVATDLDDVNRMLKDISEKTESGAVVSLQGFTDSGLTPQKVGGGFTLNKKLGNRSELKELLDDAKKLEMTVSMDFDITGFTKSSGGFSTITDTVKTANLMTHNAVFYNVATNDEDERRGSYFLLSRSKLLEAAEKLEKATDKLDLDVVSLSRLSSFAYSDYTENKYYCKNLMSKDVTKILSSLNKKGKSVVTKAANGYAAVLSSHILSTPIDTSQYDCLDEAVPFYQLVFKGNVPMYSPAINTASDNKEIILKAAEVGMGLGFSLVDSYNEDLVLLGYGDMALSVYEDNIDLLVNTVKYYKDYFSLVSKSGIAHYEKIGNVAHTVFDNGVEAYVNYGDLPTDTPIGTVGAKEFIYRKG